MIATNIEQSRHLAEMGISMESADMTYEKLAIGNLFPEKLQYRLCLTPFRLYSGIGIPAWSLSALLELIPSHIDEEATFLRLRMDKDDEDFSIWYEDYETGLCVRNSDITEKTPIEAAYKMIVWLKENEKI